MKPNKTIFVARPVHSIATIKAGDTDHSGRPVNFKLVRDGEELFKQSLRNISEWLQERGYRPALGFGYWMKENANVH